MDEVRNDMTNAGNLYIHEGGLQTHLFPAATLLAGMNLALKSPRLPVVRGKNEKPIESCYCTVAITLSALNDGQVPARLELCRVMIKDQPPKPHRLRQMITSGLNQGQVTGSHRVEGI